jgi:tRNA-specific 2-thiouridylase
MSTKIIVGLSGGVDSSVAAYLLQREGYEVEGMFMQNWNDADGTLHGVCQWEDDYDIAKLTAERLGIVMHFVDLSKEYMQRVAEYMFREYARGRTPNPDILCNKEIKFDAFMHAAISKGADYVATGHYCRRNICHKSDGSVIYNLLAGIDKEKDQSYFLCQLSQEQLKHAIFPIGEMTKKEVRTLAAMLGLPAAERKDSQGICFIGKVDLPIFLQQRLAPKEGNIIEIPADASIYKHSGNIYSNDFSNSINNNINSANDDFLHKNNNIISSNSRSIRANDDFFSINDATNSTNDDTISSNGCSVRANDVSKKINACSVGVKDWAMPYIYDASMGKIVGRHMGAHSYTIGQRKGFGIGGRKEPLFVIGTDAGRNIVYVGQGRSHAGLWRQAVWVAAQAIHWIYSGDAMSVGEQRRYLVRIRYRQPLQGATLRMYADGMLIVFDTMQWGIASGQFAAWYDGEKVEGSGEIE